MKSQLWFSVFLIASLLSGCGPRYQYIFTPPASPEGQVCTSQCEIGKQQCYGFTQNAFNQCQMNHNMALQNYNQCRNYARNDRGKTVVTILPISVIPPAISVMKITVPVTKTVVAGLRHFSFLITEPGIVHFY